MTKLRPWLSEKREEDKKSATCRTLSSLTKYAQKAGGVTRRADDVLSREIHKIVAARLRKENTSLDNPMVCSRSWDIESASSMAKIRR